MGRRGRRWLWWWRMGWWLDGVGRDRQGEGGTRYLILRQRYFSSTMMVFRELIVLVGFFFFCVAVKGAGRCGGVLVTSRACANQVICSIVRINMGRRRPNLLNRALPVSNNASPSSRCFRTSILRRGGSFHSAMARD